MAPFEEFNSIKIIGILSNNNIKIVDKEILQALPYNEEMLGSNDTEKEENEEDEPEYDDDDETFIVIPIDPSRKQFAFYNVKNEGFIYVNERENVVFKKSESTDLYNAGVFEVRAIDSQSYSILSTKTNKYLRVHPTDPNNKIDFFNDIHRNKVFPSDYIDGKWRFDIIIEEYDEDEVDDDGFEEELAENFENGQTTFDKIFAALRSEREPFWKKKKFKKTFSKKKWSKKINKTFTAKKKKTYKKKKFKPGIDSEYKVLAFMQNPDNHVLMKEDGIKVPNRVQQYYPAHGRALYKQIGLDRLKESYSATIPERVTRNELNAIRKDTKTLRANTIQQEEELAKLQDQINTAKENTKMEEKTACGHFKTLHGGGSEGYPKPQMCIILDAEEAAAKAQAEAVATVVSDTENADTFVVEGYTPRFKTHLGTYEDGAQGELRGNRAIHKTEQRESEVKDILMTRKQELLINFNAELYKTRNENDFMQKKVSVNKDYLLNKQLEYVYAIEGETRMLEREMSNEDAKETTNYNKAENQKIQVNFLEKLNSHLLFYLYIVIVLAYISITYETDDRNIFHKIFIYLCMLLFPFYIYPLEKIIYNIFSYINAVFMGEPYKKTVI
uniref:Uncharacterized protein n=1 Tax=viral metagenome TaxID=1070528 RepID=A0A6C0C0Q3_9ZZZZ